MHIHLAGKLTGRRTKWLVLLFWVVVVGVAGPVAGKLSTVQNNEASSWLPASAESTEALDKLAPFQDQNDIATVVVYEKKSGTLTAADRAAIQGDLKDFATLKGYVAPGKFEAPPYKEAADQKAAQLTVTYNFGSDGWNAMPDIVKDLKKQAAHDGLAVHVTGAGGQAADSAESFAGLDGRLLLFTVLVVIVILLLTYRSPILWLLPVISAGVALTTAQGVVYLLAKHADLTVNGQSQGILTVLVFGAGTDYALLLVARYREELRRHEDRHEAMAFALHRAAPAIIASALTVMLGMLCLLFAEMNSTAGLGPVCAIGVAVGLLVMITLLPALLVITGRWVFWPARPKFGSQEPTATGLWAKVGAFIEPCPRTVWAVTALILGVACLGISKLDANGLSQEDQYTKEYDSVVGMKVQARHQLVDDSAPVMVAVREGSGPAVAAAMKGIDGIGDAVALPVAKGGVTLVTAPLTVDSTSSAAFDTVDAVRSAVHAVPGADAKVGGSSAILLDMEQASHRDNLVIIPIVLLVVLLILMVLLRAVFSPLLLILTVVLSFGAALGISSLLFHYVFGFAGADAGLPLFVFVFLVALGIDYNIFLMSRVREETARLGTRKGSLVALSATGGVITSAGLVLAATFLVLATMPLVAFAEIGIAIALGVILDTMIVRSVLVTALNLDLGSRIWWPSRLDRGAPLKEADTWTPAG